MTHFIIKNKIHYQVLKFFSSFYFVPFLCFIPAHQLLAQSQLSPKKNLKWVYSCNESFQSFKKHVYQELISNCSSCHNGDKKAPPHSSQDIEEAFSSSLKYVDFESIEYSPFIEEIASEHWKEDSQVEVQLTKEKMHNLLELWKKGASLCPTKVFQATQSIRLSEVDELLNQQNPSNRDSKIKLRLPLIENNPQHQATHLVKSELEFFIEKMMISSTSHEVYKVSLPRIISSENLLIGSIFLQLNQQITNLELVKSNLKQIPKSTIINATETQEKPTLLSTGAILFQVPNNTHNELAFAIDRVSSPKNLDCPQPEYYKQHVRPLLQNACLNCHDRLSNHSSDKTWFWDSARIQNNVDSSNDLTDCYKIYAHINKSNITLSPLLELSLTGKFNHPQLKPLVGKDLIRHLKTWIEHQK